MAGRSSKKKVKRTDSAKQKAGYYRELRRQGYPHEEARERANNDWAF